jgi:hypothetical protein
MFSNIHRSGNEKRHSSMDEFANPKFFDHQLSVIKPARLLNRESTNDIYRNNGSHWDFSFDNNNSPTITGSAAISKNTILDIDNFEKTTTIHPSHNENNFTGLA